jgi:hypothetical protein
MRVMMMMIKGDREPGHRPGEESWRRWASTTRSCRRPACSWTLPRSGLMTVKPELLGSLRIMGATVVIGVAAALRLRGRRAPMTAVVRR